jgi:hypothetical protein
LHNCALNRPFDDQSQERIRIETEAIVIVLSHFERKEWEWLGSEALDIEVDQTPDPGQRSRLKKITDFISQSVEIGQKRSGTFT